MRAEDTGTRASPLGVRGRPVRAPDGHGAVQVVGGAVVVAMAVLAVLAPEHVGVATVAQLLGALVCAPAVLWSGRAAAVTRGRWSLGWRLLSVAACLWAAANLLTAVSVVLPGRGLGNGIYPLQGAAMAAVLVALLAFPRPRWRPGTAMRTWLDVSLLVSSLALLASVSLVEYAATRASGTDLVFAIAYPSASLAMLGLAYELSRRHLHPPRPELALLAAAFAVWLAGAAAYATLTPDALVAPAWASLSVAVGAVLLALAAKQVTRGDDVDRVERVSLAGRAVLTAPEVAVVVTAVVVIVVGLDHPAQRALAALVTLAVVLRHAVVTSDSRRFHWRMEGEVAERTAELRHSTERYVRILDTVGDGILSTDAAGRVTFANASALALLGTTAEELLGRDACASVCVLNDHECGFAEVRAGRVLRAVDGQVRRHDGKVLPVEMHAAPEHRAGWEQEGGAVVVFRDVSERHAVEQVKRHFVASVSHELRTPLTSVRGVLEVFVDGDAGQLTPAGLALAANASRGVERLSRLVDDIIDAEKLATGEFRMQRTRLGLADLLRDTVAMLQPLAEGSGVRLEVGEVAVAEVWGDPDRIEQAVVNLVGNAVKFSPAGGVVTVETEVRAEETQVTVRDRGRGIPVEELEHVFERFHQVRASDAADKGGTGLGLTITRAIVEQHGGAIWVESVLGEGAAFCFTLPVWSGARDRAATGRATG